MHLLRQNIARFAVKNISFVKWYLHFSSMLFFGTAFVYNFWNCHTNKNLLISQQRVFSWEYKLNETPKS